MNESPGNEWWREAVFYQVYPRSLQDSNGDGIGDLRGIIEQLDYLDDGMGGGLGADAIWLSPTFPSPQKDFGYDVSDYCGVDPQFGTLADMDELIAACHTRGLRILLDYVPNHSSDQHPWFVESRASRTNEKRDWYYWRDARPDGSQPNNWRAIFGGSAWEWDEATGQYYLHSFLKEQPDLNWRNPGVERAMHDVLRFWFERGVDGFRIDVMGMVLKDPEMRDNPPNPKWQPGGRDADQLLRSYSQNWPDVFDAAKGLRRVADECEGRVFVGETFGRPEQLAAYYGDDHAPGLHLAFNFHLIGPDGDYAPWDAEYIGGVLDRFGRAMPDSAQPCWALGNHDRSRFVSRHNRDGRGQERARAAALLLLGLRGTPFIYYGEEIGMEDVAIPPEEQLDPSRFLWEARDPCRTPMPWNGSAGRGFTTGKPWLRFGEPGISVASQAHDPSSLLSLYRRALGVRKAEPSLRRGGLAHLRVEPGLLSFVRRAHGSRPVAVVLNTSLESRPIPVAGEVLLATHEEVTATLPPLGAAWVALAE